MSSRYAVFVDGLDLLDDLDTVPSDVNRLARMAINKTVRYARRRGSEEIRKQVAFPARYLTSDDRLETRFATGAHLAGRVVARDRPTSLARFVRNAAGSAAATNKRWRSNRSAGARLQVKPGATRVVRRAFAIKLKNNNMGLAIRTNGGPPRAAYKPKALSPNVWLVYGPSVAQVFDTVRDDISDESGDALEVEFMRLLDLKGVV